MIWEIIDKSEEKREGKINEDAHIATPNYCIVSDGISEHNAGNIASNFVVNYLQEELEKLKLWNNSEDENALKNSVTKIITEVNEKVYSKSKENEFQGMGATLDLLIKKGNTGYLFHAGDSAVYVLEKNNNFRKITTDDTYVESLYRRGKISRGMTYTHPLKSELQNAIGINAELELACISVDLSNVKYILMVSDGISSYLIEEEIEEVLKDNSDSASKVRQLFEKRKNPSSMAEIYKRTSPRHAKKELSEICEDISNKDDATAILIQNSKED